MCVCACCVCAVRIMCSGRREVNEREGGREREIRQAMQSKAGQGRAGQGQKTGIKLEKKIDSLLLQDQQQPLLAMYCVRE